MKLELQDSRRLTGANLYWDRPSAIIDVAIEGVGADQVVAAWRECVARLLPAVGHAGERCRERLYRDGASLLISAPIDQLYAMCELNEVAWAGALYACGAGEKPDFDAERERLAELFEQERNPRLIALQDAARAHDVPFLWDDDEVSVGYGATAQTWASDDLPDIGAVDWALPRSIPVALVTGTNGKSTTVRMAAAIINAAGLRAGLTSTDFIRVGERLVDSGDYSGTGGARMLLRQSDVEMAVLEVARGGMLRRGLGVEHANVALITNVASDHLGEYGIHSVQELIPAKFIVHRALRAGDTLVLNADDEGVAAHADALGDRLAAELAWFSLSADHPRIRRALERGGRACFLEEGWLVAAQAGQTRRVTLASEVTATRGGIVRHNIANALGAMSIALAFGIGDTAVARGLAAFRGDERDNPGRGNWFEHEVPGGSVRILVDFAHNAHGLRALADTVRQLPAGRVVLLLGQAGDRLDEDIRELVEAACSMRPDRLLVAELPGYERGRAAGEVPALIRRYSLERGVPADCIEHFKGPREATRRALADARAGDLLVLLALTQRTEALELVHEYLGAPGANDG